MKHRSKNPLPKGVYDREALTHKYPNIKPRFSRSIVEGLRRFKNNLSKVVVAVMLVLFATAYSPSWNIPPVSKSKVLAETTQEEVIVAGAFVAPVVLPHPGYLSGRFSSWHPGVDIATGLGMPIHPITFGTVEQVNFGFFGYGNHVIILHPGGYKSLYAHMGRVFVKKGQVLNSDNIIGEVGMTGRTSGPHTHLELTLNGRYMDPTTVLPTLPNYPKEEFLRPVGGSNLHKTLRPEF